MTREEAVNTILYHKHNVKQGSQIDQALDVAINALRTDGDTISRRALIDAVEITSFDDYGDYMRARELIERSPSAQPEDYTELKREFILMSSYIDVLLECSDLQRETLIGFISRLAELMPWTERD